MVTFYGSDREIIHSHIYVSFKKYVSFLKNVCATQYLRKSAVRYINKVEYTELMGVYSLTVRCSGPPYRRWTGGMMHFYLFKGLQ